MDRQGFVSDRRGLFLTKEALNSIRQVTAEVLVQNRDFDLVQKLTPVQGYAELIGEEPNNLAYHIALRQVTEHMIEFLRRKKWQDPYMADHLEKVLS
jgi:hypothetical protein